MKHPLYTILLFAIAVFSCHTANKPVTPSGTDGVNGSIKNHTRIFETLVGTWKSAGGKNFERWTRNPDGTYASAVYALKGADTLWKEHARVFPENGAWIFENTVQGQNGGKPVRFTSSILDTGTVQFSNPQHDFPTDVNYTIKDSHTLHAFIIGPNRQGGRDTIPFHYTRVVSPGNNP